MIHNPHLGDMDEFITTNINLVHSVAKRFRFKVIPLGLDYDDVVQTGSIGLLKAYERFDPCRGFTFGTYSYYFILGEIRHMFRDYQPIRVPRKMRTIVNRIKSKMDKQEIMQKYQCSESYYEEAVRCCELQLLSMEFPISDEHTVSDTMPVHDDQSSVLVYDFINALPAKYQNILKLRLQEKTQRQIADLTGVSQVQISRLLAKIGAKYARQTG